MLRGGVAERAIFLIYSHALEFNANKVTTTKSPTAKTGDLN
jgi:hypothetical protein